jgi:hypothetical protein
MSQGWPVNFWRPWASLRTARQTISVTRLHLPVEYGPFTVNRFALEFLHNICADPGVIECNGDFATVISRRVVRHVRMSLTLRVLRGEVELTCSALTNSLGPVIFRHMVRILVATLLMSLSGGICQAQSSPSIEIRVRALDYKTGRPLKHHRIAIWLSNGAGEIQYHVSQEVIRSTGEDGRAVFQLTEPAPPNIRVDTDMLPDWNCAATWQLATGLIMERGIVGEYKSDAGCTKKGPPPAASAVPGEVVIFVHQLGLFGRLNRLFY